MLYRPSLCSRWVLHVRRVDGIDPDEPRRQVQRHLLDVARSASSSTSRSPRCPGPSPGCRWCWASCAAVEPVTMIEPNVRQVRQSTTATAFITPIRSTSVASTKSDRVGVAHRHRQDAGVGARRCRGGRARRRPSSRASRSWSRSRTSALLATIRGQRLDQADGLGEVLRGGQRVRVRLDLLADVDGDDVGALLGQPDGVAAALTARGAGDEGDLSFKTARHGVSFSVGCLIVLAVD